MKDVRTCRYCHRQIALEVCENHPEVWMTFAPEARMHDCFPRIAAHRDQHNIYHEPLDDFEQTMFEHTGLVPNETIS